jgi:hypothetical protein
MVQKKHIHISVGIIIIIAIIVALLGLAGGALIINSPTQLTLTSNPSVIKLGNYQYTLYLHGMQKKSGIAYIYIGRSPVFINPILNVTVILYNYTKVNAGTQYANMEIRLDSMSNTSATVTITPLQEYLAETPDSSRIIMISGPSLNLVSPNTTTIAQGSAPVSVTTTIPQVQNPGQKVLNYLAESEYYGLMKNYSNYYGNTVNCTGALYNNSYFGYYHSRPSGPTSFQNATLITPYSLNLSINKGANGNYNATYVTKSDSSVSTGVAMNIVINFTSGKILNVTYKGAFKDQNYSTLSEGLFGASQIGNACSILIA